MTFFEPKNTQNPPHRHHYIPAFYLSRWATGTDNRVCQFSKPYNRVVPNRRHPNATGFVDKLYELKGLDPDFTNAAETKFFSPVDNAASDALDLIEHEGNYARWDSRRRSAWAVFLHSLLLRTPEDVAAFKETWRYLMISDHLGMWEERYQNVRKPNDASTLKEHMKNLHTDTHDRSAMSALVSMLNGGNVARKINDMLWHIIDTSDADFDLLTSDRPIIRTNGLMIEGGHLALPIGPRTLFVAAKDQSALYPIISLSRRKLVRECNRQVASYAVKYVYGTDDRNLPFISKHFATKEQPRLAQSSLKQRQQIALSMLNFPE